jgi:membrane protein DedA with SNARE-associated domain
MRTGPSTCPERMSRSVRLGSRHPSLHAIAAASPEARYGGWAYLAVFALMALSFAAIPAIGAAVMGWAAVVASQGKLNIAVVLIVAGLGAEASSLAGYSIGDQCVLPFGVSRLRVRRWRKRGG